MRTHQILRECSVIALRSALSLGIALAIAACSGTPAVPTPEITDKAGAQRGESTPTGEANALKPSPLATADGLTVDDLYALLATPEVQGAESAPTGEADVPEPSPSATDSAGVQSTEAVPTGDATTARPSPSATDKGGEQPAASTPTGDTDVLNPNRPGEVAKLVFVHHSVGNNWLTDGDGDLGAALGSNNYYVSDTYYEWGPKSIGSTTDIGDWWLWFRGPDSATYLSALYSTTNQNASYERPMADPGDENEIIMFKSCYPNSYIPGNPNDPPPTGDNPLRGQPAGSPAHTVGNAKGIYNDLLEYFRTRQDKLFVVITASPNVETTYAANARALNNWLVNDWLAGYPYNNVAVFDFYNVLTTNGGNPDTNDLGQKTGNHHRVVTATVPIKIEHITDGDDDDQPNVLEYPTSDDHPGRAGNQKATGEFVPLLNVYYNCWKHGQCGSGDARSR